jgi:hypothetical protein
VSIARHILDALGGSNGAPGSWAKSTVAGALATISGLAKGLTTGPGQGPVAPGQGWLAGAAAGGNSYQEEIAKRQQQQTENQLQERKMTNEEQTGAANRAYLSAQTAASIQKAQQDQGLYATKQAESAMQLRTAMISAGIPVDEVEEVTGYDQLTKDHAQQLGSGKLVAVPNGQDHKTGEDQAGALLLPTDALNKKIPQAMYNYAIGYKADPKTGEPVPVTANIQAGTTIGTLLAAHSAAMNQLGQITEAQKQKAVIDEDKAKTNKDNADAAIPAETHRHNVADEQEKKRQDDIKLKKETQEKGLGQSYAIQNKELDTVRKPLSTSLDAFSTLRQSLDEGTAAGDSVVAPALLKALVAGGGVRITQAEISNFTHGRSTLEDMKGYLQKLTNGKSITPDQRAQVYSLLGAVESKVRAKNDILMKGQDALDNANSVEEQRAAVRNTRAELEGVDKPEPKAPTPPVGSQPISVGGKVVGYSTDGGKTMTPVQ